MIAVESFQHVQTTSSKWKTDGDYRRNWLLGMQHAKPVIDSAIQAAMKTSEDEEPDRNEAVETIKRTRLVTLDSTI